MIEGLRCSFDTNKWQKPRNIKVTLKTQKAKTSITLA
jgi:hypothetical protein